jgi:DNA-binding SARP family transcriptional activator
MTSATHASRRTTTPRAMPELRLLDAFDLRLDGRPVELALPAQRVMAFLALQERPVLRSAIAGRLWLQGTDAHALGSLRSALWRLRRPGLDLVRSSNGRLELSSQVSVDFRRELSWARRQLDGVGDVDDFDLQHIRLSADLLPDWYDDWILLERERLREVRVRALEALCDRLTDAGSYHQAIEAALAAVKGEPLRESAHRCLIRVHLAEGNTAEVIRRYRLFRRLLSDALGLEPSMQMESLVARLRP